MEFCYFHFTSLRYLQGYNVFHVHVESYKQKKADLQFASSRSVFSSGKWNDDDNVRVKNTV